MEFLLTHPEEAQEMGRRGFQAILERYNWANEEKALLQFYTDLFRSDDAYQKSLVDGGQTA
jgi:spore maturation protein CgeB